MFLQPNLRLSPTVLATTIAALVARPIATTPSELPPRTTSTETQSSRSSES
ncbi:MAG: hypothetical protein SFV24_11050 [Gemmatimonadales bacterium]|nr:hypothetical protein [Gemmatimonadota bacterium]MDX2058328.1 hypothetical protein [Gemmatimonadales bacterium]